MTSALRRASPAKLNLHLHITGKRDDGFHDLDSLVGFADFGDEIVVEPSPNHSLTFIGEFSGGVDPSKNSVLTAWRSLELLTGRDLPCAITVSKNIPIGAGLGGGSGNAATTLHALIDFFGLEIGADDLMEIAARIGSDVPVCLHSAPTIMAGRGEILSPAPSFPTIPMVILFPRTPHPTAEIYKRLSMKQFSDAATFPDYFSSPATFCEFLNTKTRNDLMVPAAEYSPALPALLKLLREQKQCLFTRMTGSGSAIFGLFNDEMAADNALNTIQKKFPNYWGISTYLIGG